MEVIHLENTDDARKYFASSTNRIGHLHGGHGKVAATASIPSKYQTIVVSNNERKGFNSGSKRFGLEEMDDSPGPAKYCTASSLLKEDSASFSKKGLGGFVSKVKRFPISKSLECSVGPAQYNPSMKSSPHDFNKANCTSNFHLPIATSKSEYDSKKFQTPAPNEYNLCGKFKGKVTHDNNLAARAAFMSKTRRGHIISNSVPAPGTYNICEKWTSVNPRSAQAPFKSTTERMLLPKSAMLNPGPGTYDPYEPQDDGMQKKGFVRKHYLCIAAPAIQLPPEQPSPGPGQYDLVNYKGPDDKDCVSSSMFVSTTNRWSDIKRDLNPGPGTYNPKYSAKKRSFIYNRDEKWI